MIDRGTCKAMLRESARLMLEQADRLSDIDSKFGRARRYGDATIGTPLSHIRG